jgi:hypothetical protein
MRLRERIPACSILPLYALLSPTEQFKFRAVLKAAGRPVYMNLDSGVCTIMMKMMEDHLYVMRASIEREK